MEKKYRYLKRKGPLARKPVVNPTINKMRDDLDNLGLHLVKGFHEQFAQNQNHHQTLFLQVLTVLLTVLVGFGYVYVRASAEAPAVVPEKPPEVKVTIETLFAFLGLAMCLLSLGIALILNMALGFRRDQAVASNIRVKTGVMNLHGARGDNFFPKSFNPIKPYERFDWMPGFHHTFYFGLIAMKVLLIFSVILRPDVWPVVHLIGKPLVATGLVVAGGSCLFDGWLTTNYAGKWDGYMNDPRK